MTSGYTISADAIQTADVVYGIATGNFPLNVGDRPIYAVLLLSTNVPSLYHLRARTERAVLDERRFVAGCYDRQDHVFVWKIDFEVSSPTRVIIDCLMGPRKSLALVSASFVVDVAK